jgi:limonene-1,2-epoxide hydrolase
VKKISTLFTRRHLLAVGALAGVLALGITGPAGAARSDTEKTDVKVVKDFIAAWSDPDKAVTFLADNASVRMEEDKPPVVGPAAVAAAFKSFMTPGTTLSVKVNQTFAKGPVVVNSRVDTLKTAGKPDQSFPVVGVFVVKNGKIAEWTDYLDK